MNESSVGLSTREKRAGKAGLRCQLVVTLLSIFTTAKQYHESIKIWQLKLVNRCRRKVLRRSKTHAQKSSTPYIRNRISSAKMNALCLVYLSSECGCFGATRNASPCDSSAADKSRPTTGTRRAIELAHRHVTSSAKKVDTVSMTSPSAHRISAIDSVWRIPSSRNREIVMLSVELSPLHN